MKSPSAGRPRRNTTRSSALGLLLFLAAPSHTQARDGIELAGDILQFALPATAYGMTAYHRDGDGALQYTEAAALAQGVTYTLKYTVNAERPDGGSHSFPSGHTSISFSAAEFVRKRYGLEYGLPMYALASFVGYSRVEAEKHYVRDVLAGAAIGIASSYVFTEPFLGLQITPEAGGGYYGLFATRLF